jgi:hypothetical protein
VTPATLATRTLWDNALGVLRGNDLGGWTKPAPRLYPHQWSWDSAFVAIGLAHVDPERALRELESLFRGQWTDGRLPHIVFNPSAGDYFPGPDRWASAELNPAAPHEPATSGLIQPPVHALALERIWQSVRDSPDLAGRVRALFPRMVAWHRYLATARDPEGTGLLTIYHPWESGTDNSPRWDMALARVEVGEVAPYVRHDLKHVADPAERPTHAEYDRYLWLVETLKRAQYDDSAVQRTHPFLIRDVLMTAIFAAVGPALARVRAGEPVRVRTSAGLAPLLVPDLPPDVLDALVEQVRGPHFAGAPGLAFSVVLSTTPGSPGFQPRAYWRGPSWPVMNWLLWWALRQHGRAAEAEALRSANLALLVRPGARFAEYFEPYTAEPLGSLDQSWTAAVVLDWLATGNQ